MNDEEDNSFWSKKGKNELNPHFYRFGVIEYKCEDLTRKCPRSSKNQYKYLIYELDITPFL